MVGSPAVISINGFAATHAINEMLARLHPFRRDANSEFRYQTFFTGGRRLASGRRRAGVSLPEQTDRPRRLPTVARQLGTRMNREFFRWLNRISRTSKDSAETFSLG